MVKLIVFSGVDGAGKSTQIELLRGHLVTAGRRTSSFWARGGYTPLFSLFKAGLRRLKPGSLPAPGASTERTRQLGSLRVRRTWLTLALLDLILCYGIWLRWKRVTSEVVFCDRYIDDTLLDFRRNFPTEDVEKWALWRFLRWLSPRPDAAFLLLIPVAESQRRSKLKNEPFPDSAETLGWRLSEYQQLAAKGVWTVLDCTRDRDEVQGVIRKVIAP